MSQNLYLHIEDDVTRAARKIQRERSSDITLILPKGALLFSTLTNVQNFKKLADKYGKTISIISRDEKAQQFATEVGYEIKPLESLHTRPRPIRKPVATVKTAPKPEPIIRAPEVEVPKFSKSEITKTEVISSVAPAEAIPIFITPPSQPSAVLDKKYKTPVSDTAPSTKLLRGAAVITFLILILVVALILPSATITVFARTQPITRDLQVTVNKNATQPNLDQMIIPGKSIDSSEQFSMQFNSSGQLNVGTKAQGTIQIYNFTHQILKFGADTTTLTAGDKVYHLIGAATGIKPSRYFAGTKDVDPASLTPKVQIIADQGGEDYNLPAGTRLEIHNKVLGSLPQLIYAKSADPVDGGTTRFASQITQPDLDNAKKALTDSLFSSIKQQLQNNQNLTLVDSGASLQISSINFDKNVGDKTENFTGTVTGHLNALAFNMPQLKSIVENKINSGLDTTKYLLNQKNESITESFKSADLNGGSGILAVHYESVIASRIDTAAIAEKISGKNSQELKELLLSDPNVDAVNIQFSPFWVQTVPRLSGRVNVLTSIR